MQCVINRLVSCLSVRGFCVWGAALGAAGKDTQPSSRESYPSQWHTWEVGRGGWWTFREVTALCNQCVEFRVAQCVPVPCVLVCESGNSTCGCVSVSMRTAHDVVQCVHSRLSSLCGFLCLGRCEVSRSEGQKPPDPKGWTAPDTLDDIQGARAEEIPDCSSCSLRIPWIATAVVCQATHSPGFGLTIRTPVHGIGITIRNQKCALDRINNPEPWFPTQGNQKREANGQSTSSLFNQ